MKRSDERIIKDIIGVDCDLSPENIWMDGEASAAYVKKESARLNKKRKELVSELGREPSHDEMMRYSR